MTHPCPKEAQPVPRGRIEQSHHTHEPFCTAKADEFGSSFLNQVRREELVRQDRVVCAKACRPRSRELLWVCRDESHHVTLVDDPRLMGMLRIASTATEGPLQGMPNIALPRSVGRHVGLGLGGQQAIEVVLEATLSSGEMLGADLTHEQHIVVEMHVTVRESRYPMDVGLNGKSIEAREFFSRHEFVEIGDPDIGMFGVQPGWNLWPASHDPYLASPRRMALNRS